MTLACKICIYKKPKKVADYDMKNHPLIRLLITSKGNPKALLLMEPLWGIPFQLLAPFTILFMFEQGIQDTHIGLILSVAAIVQVFFAFFGGIITDKIGRRYATMMCDFFGWAIACVIWAISDNVWLFLLANVVNSFEQIGVTSWQCLLVEDADQKELLGIYTWINIAALVAVFFAPISGFLMARYTLVPVVRGIYIFFAINMLIKTFVTWKFCTETKQGERRKAEVKHVKVTDMIWQYTHLIPQMWRHKPTMRIMSINILLRITSLITTTFFGIYVTEQLGLPEPYLAFFPILNAVVMMLFMFVIQHRIAFIKDKIPLCVGLAIFVLMNAFLILMPPQNVALLLIYIFLIAVANALVIPRRDAMIQGTIDPAERPRILALMTSLAIAITAPFIALAGVLSALDRRLPFIFITFLFIIMLIIAQYISDDKVPKSAST